MYATDACIFRERITELRKQMKETASQAEKTECKQRIADLQVLVRQSRELAALTRHYYERGYHKDEKYTL